MWLRSAGECFVCGDFMKASLRFLALACCCTSVASGHDLFLNSTAALSNRNAFSHLNNSATCSDDMLEKWTALAQAWSTSVGAAKCTVSVVAEDGDLSSTQEAAVSVIAWDAAKGTFALVQGGFTVLVGPGRLIGMYAGVDAVVDRAIESDCAVVFRREIPESPWPQLAMALRSQSQLWWKDIDPQLGEVALKSFVKKDDGEIIVMLQGKYGSLELVFTGQTGALFAATRRIESGDRVPKNAAIVWKMVFHPIDMPTGLLTLNVPDRRRVERLDDLQPRDAAKDSAHEFKTLAPGKPATESDPNPDAKPQVKPVVNPEAKP